MSYNTPAEFRSLSIASGSFGDLGDSIIQTYLDVGASELDGVLRHKHKLPLASVPAVIAEAERVLAGFRLMIHQGFKPSDDDETTLALRYQEVKGGGGVEFSDSLMGMIASGQMLFASDIDATPGTSEQAPRVVARGASHSSVREVDCNGTEVF